MGSHFVLKCKKIIGITSLVKAHKEYFLVLFLGNKGEKQKKMMIKAYCKQK